MNNFNGGGFKKGAPKFGGKKKFKDDKKYGGTRSRDSRTAGPASEMFSTTCSDCGKACQVPFKPSDAKPVYCSNCFGMKKSANEQRGSEHRGGRPEKKSYDNKPAQQSATRGVGNDVITDLKRQITGLEVKLNRILDLINPPLPAKKAVESPKPEAKPKKVAAKKAPAKKVAKKVAPKAAPKKAAEKTTKKVAIKKAPAKVATKKVAKKVVKKTAAKKVVKKTK
jgi:CxxC-x17-CxxC domain-containing protein